MCTMAARAFQIKKNVGNLHLVDARTDIAHPLLQEINTRGMNLDDGMVLKYQDSYYHGDDALHMMALLGSEHGWLNRLNAFLFSSKTVARVCYPMLRGMRNTLLLMLGVKKINNLKMHDQPLFKKVFGADWDRLPPIMKKHYAVRPYSEDVVVVNGALNITMLWYISLMSRISGMLVSQSGDNIPVTVTFKSGKHVSGFQFQRIFNYPDKKSIRFFSRMEYVGGNEMIEFMGMGIGWRCTYLWDGQKIQLNHRGYVWHLFNIDIPLPLEWVLGKGYAQEMPIDDDNFSMWMHTIHPLFGKTLAYSGNFKITEFSCPTGY